MNSITGKEIVEMITKNKLEEVMVDVRYSQADCLNFTVSLGDGDEDPEICYEYYYEERRLDIRLFEYEEIDGHLESKINYISSEESLKLRGLA